MDAISVIVRCSESLVDMIEAVSSRAMHGLSTCYSGERERVRGCRKEREEEVR